MTDRSEALGFVVHTLTEAEALRPYWGFDEQQADGFHRSWSSERFKKALKDVCDELEARRKLMGRMRSVKVSIQVMLEAAESCVEELEAGTGWQDVDQVAFWREAFELEVHRRCGDPDEAEKYIKYKEEMLLGRSNSSDD